MSCVLCTKQGCQRLMTEFFKFTQYLLLFLFCNAKTAYLNVIMLIIMDIAPYDLLAKKDIVRSLVDARNCPNCPTMCACIIKFAMRVVGYQIN